MATITAPAVPSGPVSAADQDETYKPDDISAAIRSLQELANIQIKLQKERSAVDNLELIHQMLDGELLSEDELAIVKRSLKGLSKYAELHATYKTVLAEAQQARDLIDQIIGYPATSQTTV
ncbi:MAG: hypothetical protein ACFB4J_13930 [Elainellaceae cyanobacterium]